MKLVDRDGVAQELRETLEALPYTDYRKGVEHSLDVVLEAPEETMKSEWRTGPYGFPFCYHCKRRPPADLPVPYCPWCGSKMEDKT